jgi:hypothetical protein
MELEVGAMCCGSKRRWVKLGQSQVWLLEKRNAQHFLKFLAQSNCINACIEINYMKTNFTDVKECLKCVKIAVYEVSVSRRAETYMWCITFSSHCIPVSGLPEYRSQKRLAFFWFPQVGACPGLCPVWGNLSGWRLLVMSVISEFLTFVDPNDIMPLTHC